MGSGKSYVGKKLAEKLNYDFVDLDDYLIEKEGLSIAEIFEKHDENYFREKEKVCRSTINRFLCCFN